MTIRRVRGGRISLGLALACAAYLALSATCVRAVGLVGEVTIAWALASPPTVLVRLDPPTLADAGGVAGPLVASRTRPTERLDLGPASLPLAVNAYTGGPPDWPARAVRAISGSIAMGAATSVALGLLLLVLAHRFLRFHGTPTAAAAAALALGTDWAFVFYRKVLGGTEVLLLAAGLLVVWALWSRRWKGGVHGTVAIAVGVGLGLLAKATFATTVVAVGLAALLTRWDRPALKPPTGVSPGVLAGVALACVSPLVVAAVHAAGLPPDTAVPTHDTLALQVDRLQWGWSGGGPAREGIANLLYFFGNPLAFFHDAYGAIGVPPVSTLRALGFLGTLYGVALAWRRRGPDPADALLRFLSLLVPLQLALLLAANRDLHHLAQSTVFLALLIGLAADRVAATVAPRRSPLRGLTVALFVLPHALGGVHHLRGTDGIVSTVRARTFTEAGQADLVDALRGAGVTDLVACDYELYGMLDARAPEIRVTHAWPAMATARVGAPGAADVVAGAAAPAGSSEAGAAAAAREAQAHLLRLARGRWFVSVRPSAPTIYDWHPDRKKMARAATEAGVVATVVAELSDGREPWATVWRIE